MEGRPTWIWAAGAVLVVLIGFSLLRNSGGGSQAAGQAGAQQAQQERAPAGAIQISMASSSTKQEWLHQAVRDFNGASSRDRSLQQDGKAIFVEIVQETVDGRKVDYRSGTMITDTLSGKIKPTILSPAEESWILKFQKEWQAIHGRAVGREIGPALVRTPMVIATWQSRAKALGCWPTPEAGCTWERIRALATAPDGWGALDHPEWGKFKFGYGYVGESNSGTFTAILTCMFGAAKTAGLTVADVDVSTGCGEFMAGVEKAKIHSGTRSEWLLEQMTTGGPEYLDAIVTYESDVVLWNRTQSQNLREPLVSVYPQDGTIVVSHPFTILEGVPWVTSEQVAAARIFQKFLLSNETQRAVLTTGLRPADPNVRIESPIDAAHGANPQARLVTLEVPDALVIERIVEVWHRVKKHATIAMVFDKSGSMAGTKITAAIKGAQEFVQRMDRDDQLIWMPFDSTLYPPVDGAGADFGEQLISRIGSTPASGGTALYDSILSAYDRLQAARRASGDTRRYGIVVLSDGQDTSSRASLTQLEARLKPEEGDPMGVQIHTIAIGTDADENVLKKIANAAHGRFWKGQTADQMIAVYKGIATYY
jgi:Ca-activated chloride channel family protein